MSENKTKLSPLQEEILKRWQKKAAVTISQEVKDELSIKFDGEVLFDEPMSKHSYMRIGGPADVFLKPKNKEAIIFAVKLAYQNNIPYYFHGAGANTLIKDGGLRGLVLCIHDVLQQHKVIQRTDEYIDLWAQAGMSFPLLVTLCKDLGVADLVPLVGIPGSLGGVISMNAGTRVREIKDVVRHITVLTKEGEEKILSREQLSFEYRNLDLPKSHFILDATLRLTDFLQPEEIASLMKQQQQKRLDLYPLEFPSLGCTFKNPTPAHKNDVTVSAGRLIEESGLKNVRVGGARISGKHANFILNEDNAKAKDVLALIHLIKDKVRETSGVVLETEIKMLGED